MAITHTFYQEDSEMVARLQRNDTWTIVLEDDHAGECEESRTVIQGVTPDNYEALHLLIALNGEPSVNYGITQLTVDHLYKIAERILSGVPNHLRPLP